jgi:hypothetical protein
MKSIPPRIVSEKPHLVISSKRRQARLEKNKPTRIEIERNEERARKELEDKEINQARVEQQNVEIESTMAPRELRNKIFSNLIVEAIWPENSVAPKTEIVRRERSL